MKKCEMFCYQCQETARGTGCTKVGVCGKRPELSSMLDLLIYVTKGLSCVTTKLREEGKEIGKDVNHLVTVNLFTTITNANFDRDAIVARIKETLKVKEDLRSKLTDLDSLPEAALWNGSESEFDAKADSDAVGVLSTENEDIRSLREMIMIVFLRLVVVERRDTFHVVPLLELLRELPQHLVGIKLRVFLRQSND